MSSIPYLIPKESIKPGSEFHPGGIDHPKLITVKVRNPNPQPCKEDHQPCGKGNWCYIGAILAVKSPGYSGWVAIGTQGYQPTEFWIGRIVKETQDGQSWVIEPLIDFDAQPKFKLS